MKLIKYWCVQLFKAEHRGMFPNAEVLIFEGYSKDKPKIKLGAGVSFELFTAPDSLESRIFLDNLIDSVRFIPVYEDDGDNVDDGTQEEQTKPPSREAMIEYIKQAIGEGYQPKTCGELISNPDLLWQLHYEAVDYEYRACWRWYQNHHVTDVNKTRSSAKASSLMGMDGYVVNHGNLSVPLQAKMPTPGEIFSIVKQVEDEMVGKPLTAETAFSFAEEVKKRVADLIVIEVA
ncbi:hypothetical protein [Klebsiella variicola]|uniref:hypothetical protein n=1 Tax=Klebsiella variicola TaxID=244366 RepID=UPI002B05990A|nr:hypothetical protein [Klebsiella variicola]